MSRLSALMDRDWKLQLHWSGLDRKAKFRLADVASSQRRYECFAGAPASERSPNVRRGQRRNPLQNLPPRVERFASLGAPAAAL